MSDTYDFRIDERPDFPLLRVNLQQGQSILAEPSAMVTADDGIHYKTGLRGGFGKSLGRMFGGESLVQNTFSAQSAGEVSFASGALGDIVHYRLDGAGALMLARGAYLASGTTVELDAKWQGMRGFFSGHGLVLLRAHGRGDLFFNSYGALLPLEIDGLHYVDTGYVVAFEDTLGYRVTTVPGLRPGTGSKLKSFFLGGEGLVCEFTGRGRVWVQTRQVGSFLGWIHPYRPVKQRN